MNIRPFKKTDTDQIARLFHDTVRHINNRDYSDQQVQAWAPDDIHFRDWETCCSQKHTFIAEDKDIVTGFAQLEEDGLIDCFYYHKDYQNMGIGRALFQTLEAKAQELGVDRMYVEASITARPFFLTMGFTEIKKQLVSTRGEQLANYVMKKLLH